MGSISRAKRRGIISFLQIGGCVLLQGVALLLNIILYIQ
jgi:hypothetical protein